MADRERAIPSSVATCVLSVAIRNMFVVCKSSDMSPHGRVASDTVSTGFIAASSVQPEGTK
jgi:hypothetical protein